MTRSNRQQDYQLWLGETCSELAGHENRKNAKITQSTRVQFVVGFILTIFASSAIFVLATRLLSETKKETTIRAKSASASAGPSDSLVIESQIKSSKYSRGKARDVTSPACIDHEGNARDWFIAYKLPKLHDTNGYEYVIMTSDYNPDIMKELLCVKRRKLCSTVREVLSYYDPNNLDKEEPDEFWDNTVKKSVSYDGLYFVYKEKLWVMDEYFNGEFSQLLHRRKLKYLKKKNRSLINDLIKDGHWIKPGHLINDDQSAIVRSLNLAYKNSHTMHPNRNSGEPINSLFYNDELPEDVSGEHKRAHSDLAAGALAHAKGVVIMDESNDDAIWMSHSLPKFPSYIKEGLYFHNNSHSFGQTFMCLSFKLGTSGKQVIDHLVEMNSQVYDHVLSDKMVARFPKLKKLIGMGSNEPGYHSSTNHKLFQEIETTNHSKLKLFSKDHQFDDDLYSEFIEHELNSSLLVQTWRRGSGNPLPSSCPPDDYHTNNINILKLTNSSEILNWPYLDDHSKWGINEDFNDRPWFCISDINRMHSQFKRGGGAICFECIKCRYLFSKMVEEVEACPKNTTGKFT